MEDLKLIIAKNIADLRKLSGLTQIQLAQKLNYSDKAISKWERGDSVPDITVLKEIADLFDVPLDYLVQQEHDTKSQSKQSLMQKIRNHGFITGMCILLVWLIATLFVVISNMILNKIGLYWLAFVYALPATMIVWLIFNSIWFNARRNFLIISFLMWSVLGAVYISLLFFGFNSWEIFFSGIPGQIIILMWSRLKFKTKNNTDI